MFRHFVATILVVLAVSPSAAAAQAISREARAALAPIIPEGYQTVAVISCNLESGHKNRYVAALMDTSDDLAERVVRLLYLSWDGPA